MNQPRFRARSGRYAEPPRPTMTRASATAPIGTHDRLVSVRRRLGLWVGLAGLPALLLALSHLLGAAPRSWVVVATAVWVALAAAYAVVDVTIGRGDSRRR